MPHGPFQRVVASPSPQNRIRVGDINELQQALENAPTLAEVPDTATITGDITTLTRRVDKTESRVFDLRNYGVFADGVSNDGPAIAAAYAALQAAGGGEIFFPPTTASYVISVALTLHVTVPLTLNFNGQKVLRTPGQSFIVRGDQRSPALTLGAAIARGEKTITLTSAATVQAGDIFDVYEAVVMETSHGSNRRATYCVRSVSGNVVTLTSTSKMVFSTSATVTHYRSQHPVVILNGTLHFASTPTFSQPLCNLQGLRAPRVENVVVSSDQAWVSGLPAGFGFVVSGCVDAAFISPHADGVAYGINVAGSLSTTVTGMTARNTRHPVVPSDWANGLIVNGLVTSDCYQTIDGHPSFDVHYANVFASRDEQVPNLRTVGGSIVNAHVTTDGVDADPGPFYQSSALTDLTWYDQAVMTLENMTIVAPARTTKPVVGATYGHVVVKDVVAFGGDGTIAPTFANTLKSLRLDNCRNPDGTAWRRKVSRVATRVAAPPALTAYLDTGVYHIDPFKTLVDSRDGVLRAYGSIIKASTTDPQALSIRVWDNAFPEIDYSQIVFGRITLTAFVRHNNAGAFDSLAHTYDVYHRVLGTSSITMPLVPSRVSALTGQANETLAIAATNPTQAGVTQLGTVYPASWFQFDVAVSSGRTSPIYTLAYEIELYRE